VLDRAEADLTFAIAGSTALSRAGSGISSDAAPGAAATIRSPRQSTLAPGATAVSDPRRAYTVNETARILSLSRSTIYKLIQLKRLKTLKLCGRRLIIRDSIEDLLASDE
jgi:excisionase family DNA binding protein